MSMSERGQSYAERAQAAYLPPYVPPAIRADTPPPLRAEGPRLPIDPAARKALPVCTGVLDYFPDALLAVAAVSQKGNDQHNPGQPLHWARGKSMDNADTIIRHLMERGTLDIDGMRHTAKAAWRILALLQLEIEADAKLPLSRGSRP
jgi:hypothetical protein